MILKKHIAGEKKILAICDSELLGKKIETETLILDLSSNFYKGEKKSESEILMEISNASSINAVGIKTINFLIKEKIISENNVKKIKDIPYINIIFYY
ncbi:MAG: DUF424 domain-containing protein [Candidatus Woesearchaeota archaeon]